MDAENHIQDHNSARRIRRGCPAGPGFKVQLNIEGGREGRREREREREGERGRERGVGDMLKVEWFACLRGGDPTSPSNNRVTNSCRKELDIFIYIKKEKERERERERRGTRVALFFCLAFCVASGRHRVNHSTLALIDAIDAATRRYQLPFNRRANETPASKFPIFKNLMRC